MTLTEWYQEVFKYRAAHPEQRVGQSCFNSLYEHKPDLANQILCTTADPFYRDERVPLFFQTVEALWQ